MGFASMGWECTMSLVGYAVKRAAVSVLLLLAASLVIFSLVRLIPGDPAQIILGQFAEEGAAEAIRKDLGLDEPFFVQYVEWLTGLVTGNWGESIMNGTPIVDLITTRFPRSLQLAFMGVTIGILIALPLGIYAASHRNSNGDYGALFFSQFGVSIPNFWLGIMFILFFARYLNVLPASGHVPFTEDPVANLKHAFLPAMTIGIINAAIFTRYIRSEMLEELGKDYVRTARAFGHSRERIIRKYVFKNAAPPTVTIVGVQFGYMIGGIVIIEQVFTYPGLGQLLLDSLFSRDYPVVQLALLTLVATFIFVNLIVDLAYGYLDPKIKY